MLENLVTKKIYNYLELIRFNKPIGFLLLMWPCWFALAISDLELKLLLFWLLMFFFGSFLMRSAGCIINDLVDRDIDIKVLRTAQRPIASNKVNFFETLILLSIFLFLSLLILLQFNYRSIFIGLLSFPLVCVYPFMKRITFWPQFFLGIIFSWGVLIVNLELYTYIQINYLLLYLGCIFWTLGYDTIYAYQDIEDDIKSGIKSTAVYFDQKGMLFVKFCYSFLLIIVGYLGWNSSNSVLSLIIIAIIGFCTYIALKKWDLNSVESSNFYFRQNNYFAMLLFIYLLIF